MGKQTNKRQPFALAYLIRDFDMNAMTRVGHELTFPLRRYAVFWSASGQYAFAKIALLENSNVSIKSNFTLHNCNMPITSRLGKYRV